MMSTLKPLIKPSLRGYLHQEAFFIALGACSVLIALSTNEMARIASITYSVGLLMLFGISAVYHRPHWEPKARSIMKRFDQSAIFIQIAGTFTPLCLLVLPQNEGKHLLMVIWSGAFLGILQSVFWVNAPRWLTAIFYVLLGWLIFPYVSELKESLGNNNISLIIAGGLFYTIGAIFYALKKPKLNPAVFGYHELFHLFTIIAAGFHFIVIYQVIHSH